MGRCLPFGYHGHVDRLRVLSATTSRGHSTSIPAGQELFNGAPLPCPTVETSGSPRFLGSHNCRSASLLDPGRASLPGLLTAVPCCPRFDNHEGPFDHPRFRGSLTRLSDSLSTLPRLRYLRRARLASGWWPTSFRVGLLSHMAPLKGFRSFLSSQGITSSFPRLLLAPCLCGEYFLPIWRARARARARARMRIPCPRDVETSRPRDPKCRVLTGHMGNRTDRAHG